MLDGSVKRQLTIPFLGVIAAGVMTFITFLISLPGAVLSTNRIWLKITGFMIAMTALVTLVIGVDIWFSTLQTRSNLGITWEQQTPLSQSLLQQKVGGKGRPLRKLPAKGP